MSIYDLKGLRESAAAVGFKGTDEELILEYSRRTKTDPADNARYFGYDMGGKWGNRASASIDSYQGNLYGLAEAVTGADWARRGRQENEAAASLRRGLARSQGAIQSWDDVNGVGDFFDYAGGLAVDSAPYLAEAVAGGLVTRGLSTGLRASARAAEAAGQADVAYGIGKQLARRSAVGGAVASYPSSVGDILQNQREAGDTTDLSSALIGGVPYAALNMFGLEGAASRGGLARGVKYLDEAGALKRWAGNAAINATSEGLSETGQEVVNQYFGRMAVDPNATLTDEDALRRYKESFIGGAILGGMTGGFRRSENWHDQQFKQQWDGVLNDRQMALEQQYAREDAMRQVDMLRTADLEARGIPADIDGSSAEFLRGLQGVDPVQIGEQPPTFAGLYGESPDTNWLPDPDQRGRGLPAGYGLDQAMPDGYGGGDVGQYGTGEFATRGHPDVPAGGTTFVADQFGTVATTAEDALALAAQNNPGLAEAKRQFEEQAARKAEEQRLINEERDRHAAERADAIEQFEVAPGALKYLKRDHIKALAEVRAMVSAGQLSERDGLAVIGELKFNLQAGDNTGFKQTLKEARERAAQQPVVSGDAGVAAGATDGRSDQRAGSLGAARPVADEAGLNAPVATPAVDTRPGVDPVVAGVEGLGAERTGALTIAGKLEAAGVDLDAKVVVKTAGGKLRTVARRELIADMVNADPMDSFLVRTAMDRAVGAPALTVDQLGIAAGRAFGTEPITGQAVKKRLQKYGITEDVLNAATATDAMAVQAAELGEMEGGALEGFRVEDSLSDAAGAAFVDPGKTEQERKLEAQANTILKQNGPTKAERDLAAVEEWEQGPEYGDAYTPIRHEAARLAVRERMIEALQDPRMKDLADMAGNEWDINRPEDAPAWSELEPHIKYLFTEEYAALDHNDASYEEYERAVQDYAEDIRNGTLTDESHPAAEAARDLERRRQGGGASQVGRSATPAVGAIPDGGRSRDDSREVPALGAQGTERDAPQEQQRVTDADVSPERLIELDYEQLHDLFERARSQNSTVERELVSRWFGAEFAQEFAGWTQRKRDRWLNENLTVEQENALQERYVADEHIMEFARAANNFDTGSADALGRSIAVDARNVDKPGFFTTPEGFTVVRALRYAKERGMNLDAVLDGMRSRAAEWAGRDAPELFARLFRETGGSTKPLAGARPFNKEVLDGPKYSKAAGTGSTIASVKAEIAGLGIKDANRRVTVVQTLEDLPQDVQKSVSAEMGARSGEARVQAFVVNGRAYLVAANIAPGNARAVFLHEVGSHLGLENLLTAREFTRLAKKITSWADANDGSLESTLARKAIERAGLASTPDLDLYSEVIAYFVEEAVKAGVDPTAQSYRGPLAQWFAALVRAIKEGLRRLNMFNSESLTAQDIVDLAYGAAHLELDRDVDAEAQFSKSDGPQFSKVAPLKSAAAQAANEGARNAWTNIRDAFKKYSPVALTNTQLAEQFGDKLSALRSRAKLVHEMTQTRAALAQAGTDVLVKWDALPKDVRARLHRVMQDATMMEAHPDKEFGDAANAHLKPEMKAKHDELRSRYKALGAEAQKVYADGQKVLADQWKARQHGYYTLVDNIIAARLEAAIKAGESEERLAEIEADRSRLVRRYDDAFAKIKGPYWPLIRFGEYLAVGESEEYTALRDRWEAATGEERNKLKAELMALRKDAKHYKVIAAENRADLNAAKKEMAASGLGVREDMADIQMDSMSRDSHDTFMKYRDALIDEMGSGADVEPAIRAMSEVFLQSLPEIHALHREAQRVGVAGASLDMQRAFATTVNQGAFYASRLKYASALQTNAKELRAQGKGNVDLMHIVREMQKRQALDMRYTQTPVQDMASSLSWLYYLGVSPAFLIMNSFQTALVAAPVLAGEFGAGKAFSAVRASYLDALKLLKAARYKNGKWDLWGGIDESILKDSGERLALRKLLQLGIIDEGQQHEINMFANDSSRLMARMSRGMGWATQQIELVNRISTALAAYRLSHERGGLNAERKPKTFDDHVDFAYNQTLKTQMDYSAENTARLMRQGGPVPMAKLVFQFRRYQQGMLYLLGDNLKKLKGEEHKTALATLLYLTAGAGMSAGAMGLPFMGALLWALDKGLDDDDERGDAQTRMRNALFDLTGDKDMADALAKGLPALFGVDISKRIGLGDIASPFPMAKFDGRTGKDDVKELLFSAAGPSAGLLAQFKDGYDRLADGDVAKGLEKLVPKFAADIFKATRYFNEGMTDSKGEPVPVDVNPVLRALGVSSTSESRYYEGTNAIREVQRAGNERLGLIEREFKSAVRSGDFSKAREMIAEWNADHPSRRIKPKQELDWRREIREGVKDRAGSGVRFDAKRDAPYKDTARFATAQ